MHFVTICDSEDSSSSDSDTSNENGSFAVGSLGNECVGDVDSTPAVGMPPAVSVVSAALSARDLIATSANEHCRVRHSPVLSDAVNGSAVTSLARSGHNSTNQPSVADDHCQHICKSCFCHVD